MSARLPLRIGSSDAKGDDVTHWQRWAGGYAKAYVSLMGAVDGYFGNSDDVFVREMQRRLIASGHPLVIDGIFGERMAGIVGYAGVKPLPSRRPIWIWTAPGSGADYWLGPSHDLGQMVTGAGFNGPGRQSLAINHQPIKFEKGGYLGLMGGDPRLSYNDVLASHLASVRWLLQNNADVTRAMEARRRNPSAAVDFEGWFSGYSQSADATMETINTLFGPGGEFELIRDRINGLILFGNPATPKTGIARKTFPDWLNALVHNINTSNDFYAVAKDRVRPLFYEWFIEAETELPFVVYSAQIILPAIARLLGDLGPIIGPFFPFLLAAQTGLSALTPLITQITNGVNGATKKPNQELIDLLSVRGILTSLPELVGLLVALPGLQSHGAYHLPVPEFGGLTGPQKGYDIIAKYRR